MAAKFEVRSPKAGEFRWVLVSQGRTLATSESFSRRASCVKAIESLRKAAPTAIVQDNTAAAVKAASKSGTAAKTGAKSGAKKAAAPRKRAPRAS